MITMLATLVLLTTPAPANDTSYLASASGHCSVNQKPSVPCDWVAAADEPFIKFTIRPEPSRTLFTLVGVPTGGKRIPLVASKLGDSEARETSGYCDIRVTSIVCTIIVDDDVTTLVIAP